MNDIKKAIKTAKENYITAIHDADGDNSKYEKDQLKFYKLVICALQEKVEREKGCEHCRGWDTRCGAKYCPMCGRKLGEQNG